MLVPALTLTLVLLVLVLVLVLCRQHRTLDQGRLGS